MAKLIDNIVGQEKPINNWLRALQSERLAGVYLFVGPSGIGKRLSAWALAQTYLCQEASAPCGHCPSCLKVAKQQSENVLYIEPQGTQIKTEQAAQVLKFLSLKSWGARRVVIIDQVQSLNPSAANALLKTLEDPPSGTQFFLIAPSSNSVLATLRSRCQVFTFQPLTVEAMKKVSPAPTWVLKASRGSFEKVEQFQAESATNLRHQAAEILESCLLSKNFLTDDNWREKLKEKAVWPQYLMYWNYLIRDAIYTQLQHKEQILNSDLGPFLSRLAEQPTALLLKWQENILKWENELSIHRDPQLQMESFYIQHQRREL